MEGILIPGFARSVLVPCMAMFMAAPACADVIELDGGEMRWVAGGPDVPAAITTHPRPAGADIAMQVPESLLVPNEIVADPAAHASALPDAYRAKVHELSARFDLSPTLIEALVWQESRWRPGAVSPKGARGLAQLMPATARELGVDPSDPFANLEGGARYLRQQIDRFDGDLEKALAAYNAGPGRVEKAGGIPRIRETQQYVAAIMGRLSSHSRR